MGHDPLTRLIQIIRVILSHEPPPPLALLMEERCEEGAEYIEVAAHRVHEKYIFAYAEIEN